LWLSWKGFERLAWVLELDRKACSKPASKRFEELELALEVKLEGIIEAVLEEHREAGEDPGAGSRTHSRGFLREESGGCNGLWRWIRKTFPGLASKRCDGRARALEVDLEGIIKAGLQEIWKWLGRLIRKAFPRLASKGFKSLERHLELRGWPRRGSRAWNGGWSWISKAISRLASKTFERLKRALKLDLEGTLEAGFEEIPEAGMVCGFGTGRHSQGWLRRLTLPQALCGKFQPMSADLPVEWPPTIMPKGHEAALVSVPLGGTIFNGGCVDTRSACGRIAGPIPVPLVA
jgi:hypothetical protein